MRFAPSLRLEESLSLAAFLMSLSITLINIYYAARGSEVAVDPPAQLILYRDGSGDASVLTAAARLDMINVADGYGDVVKEASLSLAQGEPEFAYQGTLRTVFVGSEVKPPQCELGLRCVNNPGLHIIERSDEILDVPSGAAKSFHLSFPAIAWNCAGPDTACGRYGKFEEAVQTLARTGLKSRIRLRFHSDGERVLKCTTGPVDLDYLAKIGWISVPCSAS